MERYLTALIEELRERGKDDPVARTDATRRPDQIAMTPQGEKSEMRDRRNQHFRHNVALAAREGTRYVGMGKDHSDALGGIPGVSFWDMAGVHLAQFEQVTEQRRQQAAAQAVAPPGPAGSR